MTKKNIAVLYAEGLDVNMVASSIPASARKIDYKYTKSGTIIWKQCMMDFGQTTRNGFDFKKHEFQAALNSESVQQRLKGKRFFGELDHPPKTDVERFLTVNLKEASHRINSVWFEGDKLWGEFETMTSKNGEIVRSMIEMGAEIAVSYRGCGYPRPDGGEDICWTTWDVVYHPSSQTALSVEDSFKMKTYAECITSKYKREDIRLNGEFSFINVPKNINLNCYAESDLPTPEMYIKSNEGEVVGFAYTTKEEKERASLGKGLSSLMRGF